MFTAQQTIDIWERGEGLHPIDRGLMLLSIAWPDVEWEQLAGLPLGRRDAALMELRCRTFGNWLEGYSRCPTCDQEVEFSLDLRELLQSAPVDQENQLLLPDGQAVSFRLPNSVDLAALVDDTDAETMHERLAHRCVLVAEDKQEWTLTKENLSALSSAMEEADPLANVWIGLHCPECDTQWESLFDILAWFWEELSRLAGQLLGEVHLLASRYGWSEQAILAMSAKRRKHYIEMIL